MSVSLVVIRLELSDQSDFPHGFQYCAGELQHTLGLRLITIFIYHYTVSYGI